MSTLLESTTRSKPQHIGSEPEGTQRIPALDGWRGIAILLVLAASSVYNLRLLIHDMPFTKADIVPVWVGSRAVLAHQNPYAPEATREIQKLYYGRPLTTRDPANRMTFAYPAHIALVLWPIAHLQLREAQIVFLCGGILIALGCIPLWLGALGIRVPRRRMALLALLVAFSLPMLWGLRLQQPTILIAGLLAAACFLATRNRDVLAGVALALATIKPQFALPVLGWMMLWAYTHHRLRLIASCTIGTAALMAGSLYLLPDWISQWRAALAEFASYRPIQPPMEAAFGHWLGGGCNVALIAIATWALWRMRRDRNVGEAASLALAVAVAVLPTDASMAYNQILLVPAGLVLVGRVPKSYPAQLARRIALGFTFWGFLAPLVAVGTQMVGRHEGLLMLPFNNMLLPVALAAALCADALAQRILKPER
jgi:Glycosyltransferase family 87